MMSEQVTREQPMSELAALRQGFARLETLLRRQKQAEALCNIAQTAGRTLGLEELIDLTLDKAVEVMDADMGLVYLLDVAEKALLLKAHAGVSEQVVGRISAVKFTREDFRKMPKGEVLEAAFSQLFRDTALRSIAMEMRGSRAQSLAAVPFWGTSGMYGVMAVGSRIEHKFGQDDMDLLGAVGRQVGVAIENAVLLQQVRKSGTIDGPTGLYNWAYFRQRLEEEAARSSRYRLEFSIIMFDMDGFESYVARCGDIAASEIIRTLGTSVRDCIREVDMGCRYGRSRFVVILPHTDSGGAEVMAERLRQKAIDIFALTRGRTHFDLTISLGIASFPTDAPAPDELVQRAELALGMARKRGGNQACLASDIPNGSGTADSHVTGATEEETGSSVSTAYAMAAAVDAKTHSGHSQNVAIHAVTIGEALGLSKRGIRHLRTAALLHDIGKARVPDIIVKKPAPLTEEEQRILGKHPELGAAIAGQIPDLDYCVPAIRHHHERYDGTGYPQGLKGEEIPIEARIIAVADAYDNMTAPVSNRQPLSPQQALEELRRHASTSFDPQVLLAFIKAMLTDASV